MANTLVDYQYRDASNFKKGRVAVLAGELTPTEVAAIMAALDDGEHFIPSQVGLEDLQRELSAKLYEDDHVWHELLEITGTDLAPNETLTARQFADHFADAARDGWDIEAAVQRVGLGEDEHGDDDEPGARESVPAPSRQGTLRDALGRRPA